MQPKPPTVRLEYSSPKMFLSSEHRYRSPRTIIGIVFLVAFSGFFAWCAVRVSRINGPPWTSIIHREHGNGCGRGGPLAPLAVVGQRPSAVIITADGMSRGRKLWTWRQIASVSAERVGPKSAVIILSLRGPHGQITLMMTPLPTPHAYNDLVKRLATELADQHPQVRFLLLPEDE